MEPLIEIKNVSIKFFDEPDYALAPVSFSILKNETLGLHGSSGQGKSLLSLAITGLLPDSAIAAGMIDYHFEDSFFSQDLAKTKILPRDLLLKMAMIFQNPQQALNPTMKCGRQISEALLNIKNKNNRVLELLAQVKIKNVNRIAQAYPHEISGGQQQRILIAIALAKGASFLVADEATASLDVSIERNILDLISSLQQEHGMTILWTSHDKNVMNKMADRIYSLEENEFIPKQIKEGQQYREAIVSGLPIVLSVKELSKTYQLKKHQVHALKDMSFDLREGEILGILGESGSGKSTVAKILAGILPSDSGSYDGLGASSIQMIFQNPASSLTPSRLVLDSVAEVVRYNQETDSPKEIAKEILQSLDIQEDLFGRFPYELSGGQQQRVAIAKALGTNPKVLIVDEPTASLDSDAAQQVNEVFLKLVKEKKVSIIYISHDVELVKQMTDRVMVVHEGKIVEMGETKEVYSNPQNAYAIDLLG